MATKPTIRERVFSGIHSLPQMKQAPAEDPFVEDGFGEEDADPVATEAAEADKELDRKAEVASQNGSNFIRTTLPQAQRDHLNDVKFRENGSETGLVKSPSGDLFQVFDSIEGASPGMSKYEIGYGIRVKEDWLKSDTTKWPVVDDVAIDIKKGITKDQATKLTQSFLDTAYKDAETSIPGWDKLAPFHKAFWADIAYNAGKGGVPANPKALAALKAGYTSEAMIKTLDFIRVKDARYRGLLERRLERYNEASFESQGTPQISEYKLKKDGVYVKFEFNFTKDDMSKGMREDIAKEGGWYKSSPPIEGETGTWKLGPDYRYVKE